MPIGVECDVEFLTPDQWGEAPLEARRIAESLSDDGYTAGIGVHKTRGYVVVVCGQGPAIAWSEKD